jgi:hypothetical protein
VSSASLNSGPILRLFLHQLRRYENQYTHRLAMLAIKFAATHHVFLQQGYMTETMDGVLTTANKANTMYNTKINKMHYTD